ncbi:MAG: hypothetical protein JO159_08300 [Acidobacteria bacterium]|nr:hypothetical protein [Acidobacteriota bacterium]
MKITRAAFPLFLLFIFLSTVQIWAQGFGTISKKKVTMHRKLPAAIHLPGNSLKLEVTSRDPKNNEMASQVSDILQAQLLKYNSNLRIDPSHPDAIVTCLVTNSSIPPVQDVVRNVPTTKKVGKNFVTVQEPRHFYEAKGNLDLTYQAKDAHSGKTLDSELINLKYAQEFDESGASTSTMTKGLNALKTPWNKVRKSSNDDQQTVPSPAELQQMLARRASSQIAARLVNTDETVEAYLARGKLDEANKMADAGQWTRMLESLEQMTPLPGKEDDAYRLYNIGVAYEALGYQSEDPAAAKRFFDQAAISYGKAVDSKPGEKYFLEPQNRIETALAHYRKLEQQPVEAAKAAPASPAPANSSPAADAGDSPSNQPAKETSARARGLTPAKPKKAAVTNAIMKEKAAGAGTTQVAQDNTPPLTNDQVIKLFKAGMDEENLISTINEARSTNFDVSVDGELQLVGAGIKGKLLAAIRRKAASQKLHK